MGVLIDFPLERVETGCTRDSQAKCNAHHHQANPLSSDYLPMSARFFSVYVRAQQKKVPGFLKSALATSEPALTKPEVISRPFGFDEQIQLSQRKTSIRDMFSEEAKERRQRQLDYDLKHSSFYEFKSFNNTKGKIFQPPASYFKKEKSKFFPDLMAKTLSNNTHRLSDILKDRVTILRIFSTISGEKCANTYVEKYLTEEGYEEFCEKYPRAQIVDLNIPQTWAKGLFAGISKGNLRRKVNPARHDSYFLIPHGLLDLDAKTILKCGNTCAGYLYVLDSEGHIRWATSGNADEKELEVLWKSVRGISRELSTAE
ncbi:hypothetical protein METBIDRAFT_32931 [Metschnikowia bicuspidata var. bicuspidata NRRL YB-4993]|uniref:Mitochondrial ATPase complex subunit ATP10 n=1 Tax=Metschnikowia bicuspidata var. bicuspidata NRRL YB-4993 TaxID=869754 RepID=A0A1A0H7N3_9ASCO|nr:hypothetical protein METBIDRAFT_32931 [Metschnikowia bicuspidata var. bicuspidata NRRL YB-4993]OBA19902.1 hypothetical protein METBIDRAFT_32931 [Metschnikowia bicuspidata var. bicuspidata NRRL YB-4993]